MLFRTAFRLLLLAVILVVGDGVAWAASVVRGPYLQSIAPTRIVVRWRTDVATNSRVSFGTTVGDLSLQQRSATLTKDHSVTLTGLKPDTVYFYSVGTSATALATGADFSFKTPPPAGTSQPIRVWAIGDSGSAHAAQVRDGFTAFNGNAHTDVWLMLGDNAYETGSDAEYQAAVFNMFPAQLRNTVLWSTIGNHDTAQSHRPANTLPYFDIFSPPTRGECGGVASGTRRFYSFDYGNVHFVCLDSMTSDNSAVRTMAQWLEADLAQTSQSWIVAFWHHPPYSKAGHNSDAESELIAMRENIVPILEAGGVDLVLCGHSHAYERSKLINGHYGKSTTLTQQMVLDAGSGNPPYVKASGISANQGAVYVVAGTGSKVFGNEVVDVPHPVMHVSFRRLGSVVLDISGERLDLKFIGTTGSVDDSFTIQKAVATEPMRAIVTGDPVPGESAATFKSFGVPSINDSGELAFLATISTASKNFTAVFAGEPASIVASTKGEFAKLGEPMLNGLGEVAFIGTTTMGKSGLFTNRGGSLSLVAAIAEEPPGVPDGEFAAITSAVFGDSILAFTANLKHGRGVTSANDAGLWLSTVANTTLALREGTELQFAGRARKVRSFIALPLSPITRGQGYGPDFGEVLARVEFTDKSQSVMAFSPVGLREVATSGELAPGGILWTEYAKLGVPSYPAFLAVFKRGSGGVTAFDDSAVFLHDDTGPMRVFTKGERPDPVSVFSSFKGFAVSRIGRAALLASVKGPAVSARNDEGIWWQKGASPLHLVARESGPAPGVGNRTGRGVFNSFTSLAMPEGEDSAPLFTATMKRGLGGVLASNDTGLWAVDSTGKTVLVLREGQKLEGKTIRSFKSISAVRGSPAQRRSFNSDRQIACQITFTDRTQGVVVFSVP
jgi:hypothetical protein